MANPEEIKRLFVQTKEAFGKLDILINNAGVYEFQPLEEITPEHFHRHFDLNVLGLILACQESIKFFSSGGSIVNISSVVSKSSPPNSTVYSATKAAVDSITRTLSSELGPRQIRINSVNPGMVLTEGTKSMGIIDSDFHKDAIAKTPLGRIGIPKDIAPAVLFLASDDASWISGESLVIAGGWR